MIGARTVEIDESAAEVVRRVHERSYRYPGGFGGFRAHAAWEVDGESGEASCAVLPGPQVDLRSDGTGASWVIGELRSIMGHHQPVGVERSHESAPTHGSGDPAHHRSPVVVELGDELDSSYGVRDDEIETLSRTMDGRRFTIVVQERAGTPDGSSLASRFAVFFWDAETGALAQVDCYHDVWTLVDGLLLPRSRAVVRGSAEGLSDLRLTLSAHELVSGGVS